MMYSQDIEDNDFTYEKIHKNISSFNARTQKNTGLCIMHVNVRCLNKNINELSGLVLSLKKKPDIIACTEVWTIFQGVDYNIQGCKWHHNTSAINKCDGTVLYINENFNTHVTIETLGHCKFLSAVIKTTQNEHLKIGVVYRSHDIPKRDFLVSIENYLNLNKKTKNHFVVGDFNIDTSKKADIEEDFLNTMLEFQLLGTKIWVPLKKTMTFQKGINPWERSWKFPKHFHLSQHMC